MIRRILTFLKHLPVTRKGRQYARDLHLIETSTYFDPAWYAQHLAVPTDTSPNNAARHYLLHGANAGMDPGPLFSSSQYLASNPDVALAGMNPFVHFLRYGLFEGRFPRAGNNAFGLDEKLWTEPWNTPCLQALRSILDDSSLPEPERIYAAWALARWHGAQGRWAEVAPLLVFLSA